jgi:predicted alpha-1,2-mannosidase
MTWIDRTFSRSSSRSAGLPCALCLQTQAIRLRIGPPFLEKAEMSIRLNFHLTRRVLLGLLLLAGCVALPEASAGKSPADYVNPLVDTHKSRWFFFSSACRPFGMVSLSPDTSVGDDWLHGYVYGDTNIQCFSHIHGWQLYGVPVMPITGEFHAHEGLAAAASAFSHDDEIVRAGYHKVFLKRYGVTAELTSTTRVGFHRYTFPACEQSFIAFDTGATLMAGMDSSALRQVSPTEIAGYSVMSATMRRPKPFTVYFVARFSKPVAFGAWQNGALLAPSVNSVAGSKAGGYARFSTRAGERVLMKVALSYTSEDNARKNLEAELPGWDFNAVVRASRNDWNDQLGRVAVEGGAEADRIKFYTDLWHSLLGRRIVSDADGSYCDNTGAQPVTRRVQLDAQGRPLFPHYNFDALWGSHWSLNILWSFAYPEVMDGFCNTMVDMYRNGGLIPRGPSGGNYTFVMIGDPAAPFFAAAYNKGIRGYDAGKAYEGLRKNALPGGIRDHAGYEHASNACGGGMRYYIERGYVPEGIEGKGMHKDGAAMTLEYAYQDWCLSQFALALGKTNDAEWLAKRSLNYTNLWDPSVKFMRPRNKDGSWLASFAPVGEKGSFSGKGFCEANSAIYTHFVPHDMPGLIRLFGGADKYVEALNRQFEIAAPANFIVPHGEHGGGWVDYDNEPSMAMAHLFNLAGAPWLSQKWVREVHQRALSDITPFGGYNGDEDQGQLGALGVLMAIGLFDVQGGAAMNPAYQITGPVFDRVIIRLNQSYFPGSRFTITTKGNSARRPYIQAARLNGQPLNGCSISHADLIKGGALELRLGAEPDYRWGMGAAAGTKE